MMGLPGFGKSLNFILNIVEPLEDDKLMKRELRRPQIYNISKGIICSQIQLAFIEYFCARYLSQHFNIPFSSHHIPVSEVLHHYHFLTYEETDAQRDAVTCPRLYQPKAMDLKFSLTSDSRPLFIPPDYLIVAQAQTSTVSLTRLYFSYNPPTPG